MSAEVFCFRSIFRRSRRSFSFSFFAFCRRRGHIFCLFPRLLVSRSTLKSSSIQIAIDETYLGDGVATVLGVARTLLVRRLDDEADALRRSCDDGSGDGDAGAVERRAPCAGGVRRQARRAREGRRQHALVAELNGKEKKGFSFPLSVSLST